MMEYLLINDGIFVNTRLSIIDLSQNAKQPMSYKCGRYHIIYNGEIYNFLELKKDLIKKGYNFYSNSDTKVILVNFQEWKHELFNKLNGMFAFSIYDTSNKELLKISKKGFELPYSYWMNNELSEQAISLFQSSVLDEFINDKFKKNLIKRATKKTLKNRDWIFLVIYRWMSKKK